jgi:hypothetical protein
MQIPIRAFALAICPPIGPAGEETADSSGIHLDRRFDSTKRRINGSDPEDRTFFPFTLLRFDHWRGARDALEAEQIDRVGGDAGRNSALRAPECRATRAPGEPA